MRRTAQLRDLFVMQFEELYGRRERRELTQVEAAELLGMSERQFRRLSQRYEAEGVEGLADRRLGKVAANRIPVDEAMEISRLYGTRHRGWRVKHFHEYLEHRYGIRRSYTSVKTILQNAGLVARAPRRGKHRRRRERRPLPGMMLFQDGSNHEWVPGRYWDLIATMDDATSEVYSAFFVEQEGTASSFAGLAETIAAKGLFCQLYTDRGSHYWHTPKAGGKVDRSKPTQVGRALAQLGITHLPSYEPQGRGRMERLFGTLQDRLPQELAFEGITDMAEANRYLREIHLPRHNASFSIEPAEEGSAFIPFAPADKLADILCIQEERTVAADNTISYKGRRLQIPPQPHRHHYVRARLRVHEYPDGRLAVFDGPRCLAHYASDGSPDEVQQYQAA